eukprot:11625610-Ditylum_brightwellii.AAC.1
MKQQARKGRSIHIVVLDGGVIMVVGEKKKVVWIEERWKFREKTKNALREEEEEDMYGGEGKYERRRRQLRWKKITLGCCEEENIGKEM